MLDDGGSNPRPEGMMATIVGEADAGGLVQPSAAHGVAREIRFEVPNDLLDFEPLIDAINHLDLTFAYNGPVELRLHDRVATVPCEIAWDGTEGTMSCADSNLQVESFAGRGRYGVAMKPEDLVSGRFDEWTLKNVRLTSLRHDQHGAHAAAAFDGLMRGEVDPEAAFHAYVYHGLAFPTYPRMFPTDDDRRARSADGLVTKAFGQTLLIRKLATGANGEPFAMVGHRGATFTDRQITAIWLVLSFLSGRKAARVADLEFDADGHERFRSVHRTYVGGIADRAYPPIQLYGHGWVHVLSALPSMFTACHELLDENIPVDIAFEYLFGSQAWLDDTLRGLHSALDCLIEADAFSPTKTRIVVDDDAYAAFVADLMPSIKAAIDERAFPAELLGRIEERLKGANDVRHSERRKKFWARVDFEPGPNEKKALKTRHPLAHRGYVLRGGTDDEFNAILAHTHVMRNLVNRTILALLGYRGPLFDYRAGLNVSFDEQVAT